MAAPLLTFLKFYLKPNSAFRVPYIVCKKWPLFISNVTKSKAPIARFLLLSAAGIKVEAPPAESTSNSMTFEPNDPRLRSHECLKNAATVAVDSTSAVLSQTVHAVSEVQGQYLELVNVLILLMEYQLQVLGHPEEEQRMADLILEARLEISEVKRRKQDLDLLFASVEKLSDATAEVAFATGANYASTSTGERLVSAQQEVARIKGLSKEAEKRLRRTEVKTIEVMAKHEEKIAKEKKEKEKKRKKAKKETEAEQQCQEDKEKAEEEKAEEEKAKFKSYFFSQTMSNENEDLKANKLDE